MEMFQPGTKSHSPVHGGDSDGGGHRDIGIFFINRPPKNHGDGNPKPDGNNRFGIELKDRRDNQPEDGDDNQQCQKDDEKENHADTLVDIAGGDFGNTFAVVAKRHNQCAEIMDGPHEDTAECYPQNRGQPAPDNADSRADNRAGTGNRGKMVAKDNTFACGHKINAVAVLMAGHRRIRAKFEDSPGQKPPIGVIRQNIPAATDDQ